VPIHILSRDAALVRRLAGCRLADGAVPTGEAGTMAGFDEPLSRRRRSPGRRGIDSGTSQPVDRITSTRVLQYL
jgi:hypothetical protein